MILRYRNQKYEIISGELFNAPDNDLERNIGQVFSIISQWTHEHSLQLKTSGSTGKPKPIRLSADLIKWSVARTTVALQLDNEHVLLCLSAGSVGGAMMVMRSLLNDFELTVVEPSANPLEDVPQNHNYTFVSLVPYQLAKILESNHRQKLKSFKHILIGGGAMSDSLEAELVKFLDATTVNVYHSYGMTETASHIALRKIGQKFFRPFEGVHLSDVDGRLLVSITELDLKLETNDIVKLSSEGFIFLSRADDVINSGGIKLSLSDLTDQFEQVFKKSSLEVEFILCGEPNYEWGEQLVLIVKGQQNRNRLEKVLSENLDSVFIPKSYRTIEEWEMSESGKILKKESLRQSVEI